MNKERWQQVEPIYFAALELGAAERSAYLEAACAGDADLRREVEALLRSEEEAGGFLEQPALAQADFAALQGEEKTRLLPQSLQRIGQYKLLGPLGKGGMGEVHLALDTRLQRKAALKLLPAQFTHEAERVRRFAQEARAASALNHPNILTIYEIGQAPLETGNVHYIATEYVEGETLRQRIADAGQLPLSETLEWGMQITAALVAAHEAGIIHRDIKPENIMVRRDGLVKVLDFGLAKLMEIGRWGDGETGGLGADAPTLALSQSPHPHLTASGMVMGTPRYMSPEQARGQRVDARSDLFSLGIVLYEMLAGTPPFAGASPMDTISAILTMEPKALRTMRREVPAQLEQSIHRLLRKDREQRYATAQQLLIDLKTLQVALNADTCQPAAPPMPKKSKRLWVGLAALAIALLLGSWFWFSQIQSVRQPLRSEFSELFVDVERWTVPSSGWDIRSERLFIAQQPRTGYVTKLAADDFTMTFHLKLENAAGAAWALRMRDPDNYYLFHLSGAEGSQTATSYFSAYIVRDGKLGEAVSRIPVTKALVANGEYTVNITAKGNEITHLLNAVDDPSTDPLGDPLGYFKDESNTYSSGGIGFRTVGTERFSVDDLYVRPLSLQK